MTLEQDLEKARLEYDNIIDKAKQEMHKQLRKIADKAEMKYNKKIIELKKADIQRQSYELTNKK